MARVKIRPRYQQTEEQEKVERLVKSGWWAELQCEDQQPTTDRGGDPMATVDDSPLQAEQDEIIIRDGTDQVFGTIEVI